jgi:hypothetical protein
LIADVVRVDGGKPSSNSDISEDYLTGQIGDAIVTAKNIDIDNFGILTCLDVARFAGLAEDGSPVNRDAGVVRPRAFAAFHSG